MIILDFIEHFGRYLIMLGHGFRKPEKGSMYWKEVVRQMYDIGVGSLFIIMLISVFIGAVTAIQFAYQMTGTFIPPYYLGYIVRDSTIIEMAPTVSCLVLAGKVGSNIAAEVGGMRQKEHIDAMEIMGVNTAGYVIMPKILAAIIVIPMLVSVSAVVSIIGGYIAVVMPGDIASVDFVMGLKSFFKLINVYMMFVKSFVFAFLITSISCYQGYTVRGGSIELGAASTRAVVFSDIMILLADYIIALIMTS